MTPNTLLLPELREMLAENNIAEMKEFCSAIHPASTAEFMIGLTPAEIWAILRNIDVIPRANIFSFFDEELQVQIIELAPRDEIAEFIEYLPSDDRVDILDEVEPAILDQIMPLIPTEERKDIELLSKYPEETCGAEMSSDFVRLKENMTVQQALNEISNQTHLLETIYYLYVLDANDHLVGLLSAKELLRYISKSNTIISTFMKKDLITVDAEANREEAVKLVAKYDFIAIPVVSKSGRMLGIITHDDILDTVVEEMSEDAQLAAAVSPLGDTTYMETNIFTLARKRFMWLSLLLFGSLTTAITLKFFDHVNTQIIWLVTFLPMIVSCGGNSGGQSATLVITALATGDISLKDVKKIFCREFVTGILLGLGMAVCGMISAVIVQGRDTSFGSLMIVPLAVFFVVLASNINGALLPLLFRRLGWDPAIMSNPFVAGISDTLGTLIYMSLAFLFLFHL